MPFSTRVYRSLLALVPADLRVGYGDDMARLFQQRVVRARIGGRWQACRVTVAGLADLCRVAVSARTGAPSASKGLHMLSHFPHDLRHAIRTLGRQPGFTTIVVATLGIAIGAVVTAAALVQGALLQPLPYPEPNRLVSIVQAARGSHVPLMPPQLQDLRDHASGFEAIVGFSPTWGSTLNGSDERSVMSAYVSDGALELFGVSPIAGRLFVPDEHTGAMAVAVVTEGFWRRQFGTGVALAGQSISLSERPHTVVGIVADSTRMPITTSVVLPVSNIAEVYLPFALNPYFRERTVPVLNVVGRLPRGRSTAEAEAQLATIGPALTALMPAGSAPQVLRVQPLSHVVSASVRQPLVLLLAAAGCLLLIASANIMNLMLARSASRDGEIVLRASLGATRRRLVSLLVAESVVLSVAGTAVGIVLATWAVSAIPASLLADLPPSARIAVNLRVIAAAAAIGLACAAIVGLWPALRASRQQANGASLSSTRLTHASGRTTRRVLVSIEVALATVLLVCAALVGGSFLRLKEVNPGFNPHGLFSTGVAFSAQRYPTGADRLALVDRALERLGGVAGVEHVAAVNRLPFGGANTLVGIEVEGSAQPDGQPMSMDRRVITAGYFDLLGVPLREGRAFGISDNGPDSERVAIINETAARRIDASGAVGRRIRLMLRGGPGPWLRVVGVTADLHHHNLHAPVAPEVYVPYAQAPVEGMTFVLRTAEGQERALAGPARSALKALDPNLPVLSTNQAAMVDLIESSIARPRLRALFVNGFAAIALGLATIGIVGVIAYSIARERRDLGIRMALGASAGDVLRMVVRSSMTPVVIGTAAGLIGGVLAGQTFTHLLFAVSPTDPITLGVVLLVILTTGLLAAYLPARRVLSIDPIESLRPE